MATCLSTPLDAAAVGVAYNPAHTRMGVIDGGGRVTVWQRQDAYSRTWVAASSWSGGMRLTVLAWASDEHGPVLAGGATDGTVCIWEEAAGDAGWVLKAKLAESSHSVHHMAFAPPQYGPILAAAYADGCVRFFEASEPLAADSWDLQNELQASQQSKACTSLAWRPHSARLPPLLLVGTAADSAQVWMYREPLMRWELATSLGTLQADYHSKPISSVAWAPALGRPVELVAVAAGSRVIIWSLQGAADSMQVERVAVLEHGAAVWRVEWNMLGSWLAASTEGGEVCLWRPDLLGEWLLVNKIVAKQGEGGRMHD